MGRLYHLDVEICLNGESGLGWSGWRNLSGDKKDTFECHAVSRYFLGFGLERFLESRNKCHLHRPHLFTSFWINRLCCSSVHSEEESHKTLDLLESHPAFPAVKKSGTKSSRCAEG